MAFNTTHSETEREVTLQHLNKFSLNPFSFKILVESYMKNIYPKPFNQLVQLSTKGHSIMDKRAISQRKVFISLSAPGKVGLKAVSGGVDDYALKTACLSYYEGFRPKPLSFLLQGVLVVLRTPGVSEDQYKNIMRNITERNTF